MPPRKPRIASKGWDARKARFARDVVKFRDSALSQRQKFLASKLAEEAWQQRDISDKRKQDEWRADEAREAIGCRISQAVQSQFPALMAHLSRKAGRYGDAFEWELKANPLEQRRAKLLFMIRRELSGAGLSEDYADAICLDVWKCRMANASADQLDYLWTEKLKPSCKEHRAAGASPDASTLPDGFEPFPPDDENAPF